MQSVNTSPSIHLLHKAKLSEVAVSVCINGISQSVTMVSPNDLHDFAITEGLINSTKEVLDIIIESLPLGWKIDLQVFSRTENRLKQRRRTMAGPSGCGLCGIESINEAMVLPQKTKRIKLYPLLTSSSRRAIPYHKHNKLIIVQRETILPYILIYPVK